ncbi:MAG: carbohydrate kinase family protein [Clostridia bacterium]|nr:carbohydrate kinase family protein [Clostridia bacterium]
MKASVIGGINLDVTGFSASPLIVRDSNPGQIRFSPGGVGRNIAEQLARAGIETTLFTAISSDSQGDMLYHACLAGNINVSHALRSPVPTSCYLSIHDADGDMALAVNDMQLIDEITPEYLRGVLAEIEKGDVCVIDANLSPESLLFIAENVTRPLAADPVSTVKIAKLRPILHRLAAFKPNLIEAKFLTGETDEKSAAKKLIDMGVKRVVISMGDQGAFYMDASGSGFVRPEEVFSCQTNGAGDAMCAGVCAGCAMDESAEMCAKRGMAFSKRLLEERTLSIRR